MGRPSRLPKEFRREAVNLVITTGRPVLQVAKEFGMSEKTLGSWVRQERAGPGSCEPQLQSVRSRSRP